MRFNVTRLAPELLAEPQVGNVYTCKGGSSKTSPHVWVVVSIKNGYCALLGIDKDGEIISATKYGLYAVRRWAVVGRCVSMSKLVLNLEML